MASVTNNTGTAANGTVGSATWQNPGNVTQSNNNYAVAIVYSQTSKDLDCTNFGFNIPVGSTINGIEAHIERYGTGQVQDLSIKLLNGDGAGGETAQDKSAGASWGFSDTVVTFGGSSDTWNESWTVSEVNSSNFGVRIQCQGLGDYAGDYAYIDNVQITVHYTASGPNFVIKAGDVAISDIKLGEVSIADTFYGTIDL